MTLAIKVEDVIKTFGKVVALNRVSFSLPKGCILGYLGPNGAGKTTTIRILTKLLEPDSGYIELLGHDISDDFESVKHLIGVMSAERTYLLEHMTIERNLKLFGRLYGLSRVELERRINELLDLLDLKEHRNKRIYELSRGLKVRSSLCRALINSPEILFLDEPTSGIDILHAQRIRNYIKEISRKGTTIFLATHNMHEAQQLSDYLAFLDKGRILAYGEAESILRKFSPIEKVVKIKCSEPRVLLERLLEEGYDVEEFSNEVIVKLKSNYDLNYLLTKITSIVKVYSISTMEPSLEKVFKSFYKRSRGVVEE
ncbi:MAG: ABC transporter ATP-binding protein [archaeon GB-1867-035]|nr:ABC transporter ATP-binding protein [Candidatus Culexmicrobium profundum]